MYVPDLNSTRQVTRPRGYVPGNVSLYAGCIKDTTPGLALIHSLYISVSTDTKGEFCVVKIG